MELMKARSEVTRPLRDGAPTCRAFRELMSCETGRVASRFSHCGLVKRLVLKNWSEFIASHFIMFFNCAAFVDVKLGLETWNLRFYYDIDSL